MLLKKISDVVKEALAKIVKEFKFNLQNISTSAQ
jgi:hypothetical protein